MSWWEALSHYLDERERADAEAPDPWAEVDLGDSSLTDEQVAFLAFDQPGVPRLGGLAHGKDPADDEHAEQREGE